jgi:hypothetical protein
MGVRFNCPQGHKLNVKAELAGKRGICPECGVRFVVPAFSGERVEAVSECSGGGSARNGMSANGNGSAVDFDDAYELEPVADARAAGQEAIVWYVRPTAGGQYGPAPTGMFEQWVREGRVSADSWVWRTGWADWKPGGVAMQLIGAGAMTAAARSTSSRSGLSDPFDSSADFDFDAANVEFDAPAADAGRAEERRRKQRRRNVSLLLGVLAMTLLVLLVIVLAK